MKPPLMIAIMGETASGKTDLAETLADRLNAQLVNFDAFQVYRGMDVGTAKSERKAEYRLMDIRDPDEAFTVGEFVSLASKELKRLHSMGRGAVFVGGTGLYARALFERYTDLAPQPDPALRAELRARLSTHGLETLAEELRRLSPETAARTDLHNPHRVLRAYERVATPGARLAVDYPDFTQFKFAIQRPADEIARRIEARTPHMARNGWPEEVARLAAAGYRAEAPAFRAHGYRAMWRFNQGEIELEDAVAATTAEVKAYAKRQRTWLRTEPRLIYLPATTGVDPAVQAWSRLFSLE